MVLYLWCMVFFAHIWKQKKNAFMDLGTVNGYQSLQFLMKVGFLYSKIFLVDKESDIMMILNVMMSWR